MTVFNQKTRYTRDRLSSIFPDMSEEEFEELKQDILANGQREPIVVKGNSILDGWHRFRATRAVGLEPWMEEYDPDFDGEDPRAFVFSKNLHRRQLSGEDRARMVAEALGYEKSGAGRKASGRASIADIAREAKVSTKTVARALEGKKGDKEKPAPTLEGLEKRKRMLEGQLKNVNQQIAELQSTAKSSPKAGAVKRRAR